MPPAGAISLATSIMSPSAALAVATPQRLSADAAAARTRVSRRGNFTFNAPVFLWAALHLAIVWASGHIHQPTVNTAVALSHIMPALLPAALRSAGQRVTQCPQRLP